MLRFEQDKNAAAQSDLLASHALMPNPVSAFYLGETYANSGDSETAMQYYQQAASSSGEIGNQAQYKLAVLDLASNPNKYIASQVYLLGPGAMRRGLPF